MLVVEDDADDAALLMRELRRGGYAPKHVQVDTEMDLRVALGQRRWDIVIADWTLPGFSGLDAFRIVRASDADVPFLIVSGTIDEENAVEALRAGVHDFMPKGRLTRLLPAIARELADAKNRRARAATERDLQRQREETARSEALLSSVLEAVPDGVVVVDERGRVVVWSAGADRVLQMARADIPLEQWPAHYGMFHADHVSPIEPGELALAQALTGTPVDGQEIVLRHDEVPMGMWLSASARPLRASDGRVTGAVGIFRDVRKEKSAQEHLMVSDRMASVGMLAAGVAHEINNPLGAALLNLETLHDLLARPARGNDGAEVTESMIDARRAVARVREIVGDLRIFSRHEDPLDVRADVCEALEASLRMASNEIRHRARVVKDYQPTPIVGGSEGRLGQVFLNVIVNAAQAIEEGNSEENTIRVATRTDASGHAVIEVSDTGSGIRPENLSSLFTPFFTTKPPGIGTGLGLSICKRIVTQMGGDIHVESELGKGTMFRITLPPAAAKPATTPAPSVARCAAPISERRGRVLVVDDEPMLGAAIKRVLAAQHDVVTTTRAEDALERLRAGGVFDVIFSDLMMPQITGMELYARICEEFPEHAPRVVFLTGGAFTHAAREFLARVTNRTLDKPIDRQGLLALISERVRAPLGAPALRRVL